MWKNLVSLNIPTLCRWSLQQQTYKHQQRQNHSGATSHCFLFARLTKLTTCDVQTCLISTSFLKRKKIKIINFRYTLYNNKWSTLYYLYIWFFVNKLFFISSFVLHLNISMFEFLNVRMSSTDPHMICRVFLEEKYMKVDVKTG